MVQFTTERDVMRKATLYFAGCPCGWAPSEPALIVTDHFFEDAVDPAAAIAPHLERVRSQHTCKESG